MLPYKTLLPLDRSLKTSVYLQICNGFIQHITAGHIPNGHKLPGSRSLAGLLNINRRTVTAAYDELESQGWINIRPNQGAFVCDQLPLTKAVSIDTIAGRYPQKSGYSLPNNMHYFQYYNPPQLQHDRLVVDAGYPDVRLAPLKELSRHLGGIARSPQLCKLYGYSDNFSGDPRLRSAMLDYLQATRSINIPDDSIFITRGSLMAFNLIFRTLLKAGDKVLVGNPSFLVANNIIQAAGGQLVSVPVDDKGIEVDAIERQCQEACIKAVFIMPHHHNPTTVSLSPDRRMKLLQLAAKYNFAIVEDDYDYDYHYSSSPILPMASSDRHGSVIYVGSLSKTVAPSLRVGFIVAPANVITEISRLSRFVDCHGNMPLERAVAHLFEDGEIRRHLKKSLQTYRARRDICCHLLRKELGSYVDFDTPEGGLAVWLRFQQPYDINEIREAAMSRGLLIPKSVFIGQDGRHRNAIRFGFASLTEEEMKQAIKRLKISVEKVTIAT